MPNAAPGRCRSAYREAAGAIAHHAVGLHRRCGASARRVGDVVLAAEFSEPRARRRTRGRGRCKPRWSCSPAPWAACCGARWSIAPGRRSPRRKLAAMAVLCLVSLLVLGIAFGAGYLGVALAHNTQFAADRGWRFHCDLHRRPRGGDRHRRHPPWGARHRRGGAGTVPEPVRPGGRAVRGRHPFGRLGAAAGPDFDACVLRCWPHWHSCVAGRSYEADKARAHEMPPNRSGCPGAGVTA